MPKKKQAIDKAIESVEQDEIFSMPLDSYEDYKAYNEAARKKNKLLGYCRYKIKPCPEELHPTERVVFSRNDQPDNSLPVFLVNHLIEFQKTLYPGKTYDLPKCVVAHLAGKGVPVWKWYDNPDGSRETRISHKSPRFSLRSVFAE